MSRTSAARAARWESVEPLQADRVGLEHLDEGVLRGDLLPLDQRPGIGAEGRVGDHAAVSRQDVGVLGSQPDTSFLFGLRGLAHGGVQTSVKAGKLGGDRPRGDPARAAIACRASRAPAPARSRFPGSRRCRAGPASAGRGRRRVAGRV